MRAAVYAEIRGFILAHHGCAGARHADLARRTQRIVLAVALEPPTA